MGPAHGSRVWVHYGITAHPHGDITRSAALVLFPPTARAYGSITASRRTRTAAPCRTGPALRSVMLLFTKTSPAHKRVVSLVRTYISYVYIRDCTRKKKKKKKK